MPSASHWTNYVEGKRRAGLTANVAGASRALYSSPMTKKSRNNTGGATPTAPTAITGTCCSGR
jgi:hypothetical protein